MVFSASDLVKKSATQLVFLNGKPKPAPTIQMQAGTTSQLNSATSDYQEMRGIYTKDNITIFFCIDELIPMTNSIKLIEIKSITGDLPDWFKHQSIIQTALYDQLANRNTKLVTATFRVNQGHPKLEYSINKPLESSLKFIGDYKAEFSVKGTHTILDFYINKAKIVATKDYTVARNFDAIYKHKEWKFLSPQINLKELL